MKIKNINDILLLPSVPVLGLRNLPRCGGIYFVLNNGELDYIGKTSDLFWRWRIFHHIKHHLNIKSGRIAWMEINSDAERTKIENLMICLFKPRLNKTHGLKESRKLECTPNDLFLFEK